VIEPSPAETSSVPILFRLVAASFAILTMLGFALQALIYKANPRDLGSLMVPILLLGAATASLLSGGGFAEKRWLAAVCAGVGTGLFVLGEAYADVGLNVLFGGPMPWWSEKVAVMTLIFELPLVLLSTVGAYVIARVIDARAAARPE